MAFDRRSPTFIISMFAILALLCFAAWYLLGDRRKQTAVSCVLEGKIRMIEGKDAGPRGVRIAHRVESEEACVDLSMKSCRMWQSPAKFRPIELWITYREHTGKKLASTFILDETCTLKRVKE